MVKAKSQRAAPGASEPPNKQLNHSDWLVLRACHRLGVPASTRRITEEIVREDLCDYRLIRATLMRLVEQGLLTQVKQSARRSVWSLSRPFPELLREQFRSFVVRAMGSHFEDPRYFRDLDVFDSVLQEAWDGCLEADEETRLDSKLRSRLLSFLQALRRRKDLWLKLSSDYVAEFKGVPSAGQAIGLMKVAGGDHREVVLELLGVVEGFGDELGPELEAELEVLKRDVLEFQGAGDEYGE